MTLELPLIGHGTSSHFLAESFADVKTPRQVSLSMLAGHSLTWFSQDEWVDVKYRRTSDERRGTPELGGDLRICFQPRLNNQAAHAAP